jgi:hypothetical protein
LKEAHVIVGADEMHGADDVPFIESEEEAKEDGKQNEDQHIN